MVFFALSAPHTARVFELLTPDFGYVAPIGVEFGLLYAAFRRKQSRMSGQKVPKTVWTLEILLFLTAIVVNGAGSLQAVVSSAGLDEKSMGTILEQFASLPATNQVALLLVPIAALIIPVGTSVAGEGLATLFLESDHDRELIEKKWQAVAPQLEFEALRDTALSLGVSPNRANRWAAGITNYGLSVHPSSTVRPDGERTVADTPGQPVDKSQSARERVFSTLEMNPEAITLSVRKLAELSGVGKSAAADYLSEYKSIHANGGGGSDVEN
jgi:hypothetical protein